MNINQRLRSLRDHLKLGRHDFSTSIGMKKQTLANIENERQQINGSYLEAICEAYPEYAYWLVTGKTLPEAGQTSPELEKMHDLNFKEGAA